MSNSKTYLTVPYAEKDAAKALGAKWDATKKKWYAPAGLDLSHFSKWSKDKSNHSPKTQKPNPRSSVNKTLNGVVTKAKDKAFIAYSDDQPPWV